VWPYEARVELRKGLSDLLLNMGILYSRLVEVFNERQDYPEAALASNKITPSTLHRHYYTQFDKLSSQDTLSYFISFEMKLNMALQRLEQLLPLTRLEPRLKGPFPIEIYRRLLNHSQNILDKFVSMRVAIANNIELQSNEVVGNLPPAQPVGVSPAQLAKGLKAWFRKGAIQRHEDLLLGIAPANLVSSSRNSWESPSLLSNQSEARRLPLHPQLLPYRRELVGSVLLAFYIYAGSLILKQPLPTYLPPARQARQRLMARIHTVINDLEQQHHTSDSRQATPYASQTSILPLQHRDQQRSRSILHPPAAIHHPEKYINYYAYALAMEDVIIELEAMGVLLKNLYGEMFADVVTEAMPGASIPIPQHDAIPIHHHRGDQWGRQRLEMLQALSVSKPVVSPSKCSPIPGSPIDTEANGNLDSEPSFPLGSSVMGSLRVSWPKRKELQPDDAKLWRASGNWML
jgi:hypothetical protein